MDPENDKATAVKYVTLSKNHFEIFVRDLLLVRNYRVEVYVSKTTKGNDWTIEYKGSPGNLLQFEDLLFNSNEIVSGNALLSVYLQLSDNQKKLGIACIDTQENQLSVTEFVDNDFYNELEAILVLLGPRECLIPSAEGEYRRIKEVLERNQILVTQRKKNEFEKSGQLIQDLNKIVRFKKGQKADINTKPEIGQELAMCALSAALKYSELANHDSNLNQFDIKNLMLDRFVHLDAAAIRALNLFPPPNTEISSNSYKWQSVLGVLDKCKTAQGRRLLSQWIKQPLRSLEKINDRHDIVECLFKNIDARNALYNEHFNQLPDVLVLTKKLSRKKANLQDVFKIYKVK
jgi:DNA mismatch repair protein MSH2